MSDAGEGVRDHRSVRGGQGDADRKAARGGPGAGAVDLGDHPRAAARRGGRPRLPLPRRRRSSSAGSTPATSSSTRRTAATATGPCARRSRTGSRQGRSVVLEIEVQGARQVRAAMPEAVLIFIAPPEPGAPCESASTGAGTDSPDEIERRLRTAEIELEAQVDFPHVVVNDDVQKCGLGAGEAGPGRAIPTLIAYGMIKPRVDKLLEQTDSHYAAVVVAAKRARQINAYYHSLSEGAYGEYTPPMVETGTRQLPHDRPRGDGGGQAQVRVQGLATSLKEGPMARILLGVSGGIAAYKALELARLATREGHAVRVLMTPAAERFVGPASFEGIVGAPGPERRVRARPGARRLPRRPRARPRPDRAPGGGRQRGRLPDRPGLGEHGRQARGRASPTRWSPPPSWPAPRRGSWRRR